MRRRLALPLAASLAVHALALSGVRSGCGVRLAGEGAGAEAPAPVATATTGVAAAARARTEVAARAERTRRAREALVAEARTDRAAGRLVLGRFLLRASAIDAEALGQPLDVAEAEARYAARLAALREALRHSAVSEAVPGVFEDLRYHGQPGGLMAEALLEGGGSCEQIAQLVAAAVYDAGRGDSIALRYYGGVMADGATHIAPIALEDGGEHDLMSGKPAVRRGVRFPAEMLVEAYARAHGLASPMADFRGAARGDGRGGAPAAAGSPRRSPATGAASAASARPTLIAGMPHNRDRYPGALPLYAARAVQPPGGGDEDGDAAGGAEGRDCAYFVRMAALSPPSIEVALAAGAMSAEPRRRPEPWRLERQAALLGAAEALAKEAELGDRLMGWACLAALGESAGLDLALAGERRLAAAAIARAREAREAAREALRGVRWEGAEGERLRQRLSTEFGGRTWLLLFVEGGERVVLDLVDRGRREDWGQVSALAALILWAPTRAEGLRRAEALPARDQIDVMHEVFHAHDHMRPWASNVTLGDPPVEAGAAFLRGYRVYRGVAFQLWEAHRPIGEILAGLPAAARAAGLDAGWEAALIEYVGRNALGLYSSRPSGLAVVGVLKEAVLRSGHPSLDTLRRQLEYIEAQRRLDATTLADASRLR